MNQIAFIIPYFGKFNTYFPLYLKSCAENDDMCDWIIFTDDHTPYDYPTNVKIHYTTFKNIQELIAAKLDSDCTCSRPYKLCDYKPAYGYLFAEYLEGYKFYGHCDVDLIWGKISHFLTDDILNSYDKIFDLGHCTIYRNTDAVSKLFMSSLEHRKRYKEVYCSEENCSFDEEYHDSINNIFIENNLKIFNETFAANIYTKSSNFLLTRLSSDKKSYLTEKHTNSLFVWNEGTLYRYTLHLGELKRKEYIYIHFQSRNMKMADKSIVVKRCFKIIPNSFETLELPVRDEDAFKRIKKKHFNLHYFRLRFKNFKIKIKRKIGNM